MSLENKLWLGWGICAALAVVCFLANSPAGMWINTGLGAAFGWMAFFVRTK